MSLFHCFSMRHANVTALVFTLFMTCASLVLGVFPSLCHRFAYPPLAFQFIYKLHNYNFPTWDKFVGKRNDITHSRYRFCNPRFPFLLLMYFDTVENLGEAPVAKLSKSPPVSEARMVQFGEGRPMWALFPLQGGPSDLSTRALVRALHTQQCTSPSQNSNVRNAVPLPGPLLESGHRYIENRTSILYRR